jgi:hypothetical protein
MAIADWDLEPGDILSRKDRMDRFGGSSQDGIAPSGRTPNVFIYDDPEAGKESGYSNHWGDQGEVF